MSTPRHRLRCVCRWCNKQWGTAARPATINVRRCKHCGRLDGVFLIAWPEGDNETMALRILTQPM